MRYKDEAWNPNHETDAHGLQIKFFFAKMPFKNYLANKKSPLGYLYWIRYGQSVEEDCTITV